MPVASSSLNTIFPILGVEYEPSTDASDTTLTDCFTSERGNIIQPYRTFSRFYKLSYTPDGA